MAKQKNIREYSAQEKCDYFSKRVNDPKLNERQRRYAQQRLNALCGGKPNKKTRDNPSVPSSSGKYNDAQKFAYGAGIGYGAAKSGKRVNVKDENKNSFRKGYERGKALKK